MKGHWDMTAGARRAVGVMLLIGIFYAAATLFYGVTTVQRLEREITAQCAQERLLAALPVTVNPATGKASKLGVQIVSAAREAFTGAGCPGGLPSAQPSFVRWARFYHVKI